MSLRIFWTPLVIRIRLLKTSYCRSLVASLLSGLFLFPISILLFLSPTSQSARSNLYSGTLSSTPATSSLHHTLCCTFLSHSWTTHSFFQFIALWMPTLLWVPHMIMCCQLDIQKLFPPPHGLSAVLLAWITYSSVFDRSSIAFSLNLGFLISAWQQWCLERQLHGLNSR